MSAPMPVTPDAELVRMLYEEHAGPLYAFCVRYTGDSQRAEDVVQEVFVRAWCSLSRLDLETRPVRPWLLAVARNLLTDLHRAQTSRPATVGDAALAELPAPEDLDRAVESWRVAAALRRLSPQHRERRTCWAPRPRPSSTSAPPSACTWPGSSTARSWAASGRWSALWPLRSRCTPPVAGSASP